MGSESLTAVSKRRAWRRPSVCHRANTHRRALSALPSVAGGMAAGAGAAAKHGGRGSGGPLCVVLQKVAQLYSEAVELSPLETTRAVVVVPIPNGTRATRA